MENIRKKERKKERKEGWRPGETKRREGMCEIVMSE